jgi:hypothetical protein
MLDFFGCGGGCWLGGFVFWVGGVVVRGIRIIIYIYSETIEVERISWLSRIPRLLLL